MEKRILQIIPLQAKSVAKDQEGATFPVIGLALVEEAGETRLRYIQHGTNGQPEITSHKSEVEHIVRW